MRRLIVTLVSVAVFAMLFACSGGADKTANAPAKKPEPKKVQAAVPVKAKKAAPAPTQKTPPKPAEQKLVPAKAEGTPIPIKNEKAEGKPGNMKQVPQQPMNMAKDNKKNEPVKKVAAPPAKMNAKPTPMKLNQAAPMKMKAPEKKK